MTGDKEAAYLGWESRFQERRTRLYLCHKSDEKSNLLERQN